MYFHRIFSHYVISFFSSLLLHFVDSLLNTCIKHQLHLLPPLISRADKVQHIWLFAFIPTIGYPLIRGTDNKGGVEQYSLSCWIYFLTKKYKINILFKNWLWINTIYLVEVKRNWRNPTSKDIFNLSLLFHMLFFLFF